VDAARAGHLRVAAVQMRSVADLDANLARIDSLLALCARHRVAVAAFPECAVTRYSLEAIQPLTVARLARAERALRDSCRRHGVHALIGMPWRTPAGLYNAALIIDQRGRLRARHFKVHLVSEDRAWPCRSGDRPAPV